LSDPFFDHPILNGPYDYPRRHWELDEHGQPTQKVIEQRRGAKVITPIPKPKKRKAAGQKGFVFDEGKGLSTKEQEYDPTSIINEVRGYEGDHCSDLCADGACLGADTGSRE
jgi:type III restriction enzyme